MKRIVPVFIVLVLAFYVNACAANLHQLWDIPFGLNADELLQRLEETQSMGTEFEIAEAIDGYLLSGFHDLEYLEQPVRNIYFTLPRNLENGLTQYESAIVRFEKFPYSDDKTENEFWSECYERTMAFYESAKAKFGEPNVAWFQLLTDALDTKVIQIEDANAIGRQKVMDLLSQSDVLLISIRFGNVRINAFFDRIMVEGRWDISFAQG